MRAMRWVLSKLGFDECDLQSGTNAEEGRRCFGNAVNAAG